MFEDNLFSQSYEFEKGLLIKSNRDTIFCEIFKDNAKSLSHGVKFRLSAKSKNKFISSDSILEVYFESGLELHQYSDSTDENIAFLMSKLLSGTISLYKYHNGLNEKFLFEKDSIIYPTSPLKQYPVKVNTNITMYWYYDDLLEFLMKDWTKAEKEMSQSRYSEGFLLKTIAKYNEFKDPHFVKPSSDTEFNYGFFLGANANRNHIKNYSKYQGIRSDLTYGYNFGVILEFPISSKSSLSSGLYFSKYQSDFINLNFNNSFITYNSFYNLSYLHVPLQYNFRIIEKPLELSYLVSFDPGILLKSEFKENNGLGDNSENTDVPFPPGKIRYEFNTGLNAQFRIFFIQTQIYWAMSSSKSKVIYDSNGGKILTGVKF